MRNFVAFLVVAMATPVFASNQTQWETVGPELKRLVATTTVEGPEIRNRVVLNISYGTITISMLIYPMLSTIV